MPETDVKELSEIEMDGFAMPGNADEYKSLITDTKMMTRLSAEYGPKVFAMVNAGYMAAARREDEGQMDEQIAEQVEAATHDMFRENGLAVDGKLNVTPETIKNTIAQYNGKRGPLYSNSAPGAAVEAAYFGSASDAVRASVAALKPTETAGWPDRERLLAMRANGEDIQAAYTSHIGSSGGFLLPESFRNQLLQLSHESAVVRPRATVIPMSTPKVSLPAIHETNRSSTLFGGVQIYWTEEDTDSTASEAQFKVVTLEPDTMTGYAEIPNELIRDTLAFDAYFNATFPKAMAFEEDDAYMQGTGVGQPSGGFNGGAVIAAAAEGGQTADTLVYENILNMWARMLPDSMSRAVWVANQTTIPELGTMALSVGTGGAPIFVANAATGLPMTLFGRPIIFTEKANTLGEQGDLFLADWSYYLIGDLQTATVSSSEHYKFKERKTAFSIVQRIDGKPWVTDEITPRRGADTLSPFVALAAR